MRRRMYIPAYSKRLGTSVIVSYLRTTLVAYCQPVSLLTDEDCSIVSGLLGTRIYTQNDTHIEDLGIPITCKTAEKNKPGLLDTCPRCCGP
ncbi:hypothetical protein GGS23DRAFT_549193 [Durotheca rogersii]|uniref:uncharacterized protein n=1 Tax=Durotheca rogersii TaxID=419775 RepID=UPI00221E406B|nr:uncharacterized protein GGS23DRAFT_549193 [Durotheca rogersii]KAI5867619.1 hypothetical protein GGS23DRAFT_549193 [Durotheca rogersii]